MKKTLNPIVYLLMGAAFLGASGCKKKTETIRFMFVHAIPDGPSVDVYAQGELVAPGISYPGNSGYVSVTKKEDEEYFIEVKSTAGGQPLLSANNPAWTNGSKNSMYSYGLVGNSSVGRELIADSFTEPAAGKASVRFIHLASDAPAVDFLTGGTVLYTNKEYLGSNVFAGFTGFTDVNAGTYDLKINHAGTAVTAASLPNFVLQSGRVYTVFAKGLVSGSGAQALGLEVVINQ